MYKVYKKSIKSPCMEEVPATEANFTGTWISITEPQEEDIQIIKKFTPLTDEEILTLFDVHERPRIERNEETTITIFHVPNTINKAIETTPLVIIVTKTNIITISAYNMPIVADFIRGCNTTFNTTMKTRFTLLMLQRINYYFERYLNTIDRLLDEFERNLNRYTDNQEVYKMFNMQKTLIYFNTAVVANGKVLRKIISGSFIHMFDDDKELLEDIIIDNDQTIEIVTLYNTIITSSLDAYASVVSNNINVVIRFLTIVTITLSIPTLISSFWGMNVQVPFHDHPNAFNIITAISVVCAGFTTWFFLKKKG